VRSLPIKRLCLTSRHGHRGIYLSGTIVVYVRVVSSDPIVTLNEQVSNNRFAYATPTAPVQISGAAPLPIALASFTATALAGDSVELTWKTISETDNYGFVIQALVGEKWTDVSPLIPGHGTSIESREYSYVAHAASHDKWRLCQIDMDGMKSYSEVTLTTDINPTIRASSFALEQNYPNPFNPTTTIRYGLPARSHVKLTVFNTLGQQVSTLIQLEQDAGYHEVEFDGTGLPSGLYFYRVQAGDFVETRRLVLLR
jgi:hypothetical protein